MLADWDKGANKFLESQTASEGFQVLLLSHQRDKSLIKDRLLTLLQKPCYPKYLPAHTPYYW